MVCDTLYQCGSGGNCRPKKHDPDDTLGTHAARGFPDGRFHFLITFLLLMSAFPPLLCLDALYASLPRHPVGVLAVFSFQCTRPARSACCARPVWDNHRITKSSAVVNIFFNFRHLDERSFHSLLLLYQIDYFLSTISTNLI